MAVQRLIQFSDYPIFFEGFKGLLDRPFPFGCSLDDLEIWVCCDPSGGSRSSIDADHRLDVIVEPPDAVGRSLLLEGDPVRVR